MQFAAACDSSCLRRECDCVCLQVLPVARRIKAIVLVIWYSPLLSTLAACGALYLLWAHHSGTYRWETLEWAILTATSNGLGLSVQGKALVVEYGGLAAACVYNWGSVGARVVITVLDNTKGQLVAAAEAGDIESPRLAWVVWIVVVIATKSQAEIRLKTLAWPFVVLWMTALAGGAQWLPQVMLGVLAWCGAAISVRNYERRERDRVRNQWTQHVPHRRGGGAAPALAPAFVRPTGAPKERKFKDQTECSICLESLSFRGDSPGRSDIAEEDAVGALPCGHCFHTDCIGGWLQREARCPLCRQAAHGIDRVLEIVF